MHERNCYVFLFFKNLLLAGEKIILIMNIKISTIFFLGIFLFFPSCKEKNIRSDINLVIECAINKLMVDPEFTNQLISGQNFIFWKKDSYIDHSYISCYNNKLTEWSSLPSLTPDKKILQSLELNLSKLKNIQ